MKSAKSLKERRELIKKGLATPFAFSKPATLQPPVKLDDAFGNFLSSSSTSSSKKERPLKKVVAENKSKPDRSQSATAERKVFEKPAVPSVKQKKAKSDEDEEWRIESHDDDDDDDDDEYADDGVVFMVGSTCELVEVLPFCLLFFKPAHDYNCDSSVSPTSVKLRAVNLRSNARRVDQVRFHATNACVLFMVRRPGAGRSDRRRSEGDNQKNESAQAHQTACQKVIYRRRAWKPLMIFPEDRASLSNTALLCTKRECKRRRRNTFSRLWLRKRAQFRHKRAPVSSQRRSVSSLALGLPCEDALFSWAGRAGPNSIGAQNKPFCCSIVILLLCALARLRVIQSLSQCQSRTAHLTGL